MTRIVSGLVFFIIYSFMYSILIGIGYFIFLIIYQIFSLDQYLQQYESLTGFVSLAIVGCILILPGYRAKLASEAYGDRDMKFWEAHSVSGAMLKSHLSFLPIIGKLFESQIKFSFKFVFIILISLTALLYVPVKNNVLIIQKNNEGLLKIGQVDYLSAIEALDGVADKKWIIPTLKSTALRNRAIAYQQIGDNENALKHYKLAAAVAVENSYDSILNLSDALIIEGKTAEAIQLLEKQLSKNSSDMSLHNSLGIIFLGYYGQEHVDAKKALYHCNKAFELDQTTFINTHEMLIEALILNKEYDKAEELNKKLKIKYDKISRHEHFSYLIHDLKNKEANKTN